MPQIPIIMPQLGESIAEAVIVSFLAQPGEPVEADQDLIEVETNKATMNVASPCRGRIEKFLVQSGESYPVGAVLGYLEASQEDVVRLGLDAPAPEKNGSESGAAAGTGERNSGDSASKSVRPTVRGLPVPANAAGASYMSPRMKARMAELGLHAADLAGVAGSGAAGRGTRHILSAKSLDLTLTRTDGVHSLSVNGFDRQLAPHRPFSQRRTPGLHLRASQCC